jgi:hypothetical protein
MTTTTGEKSRTEREARIMRMTGQLSAAAARSRLDAGASLEEAIVAVATVLLSIGELAGLGEQWSQPLRDVLVDALAMQSSSDEGTPDGMAF